MIEPLPTFALAEYRRRVEEGVIAAAQFPARRRQIEINCRAWGSALLRIGAVPDDLAHLVADYAAMAPDWPASSHRAMAASQLCRASRMLRHIEDARAVAFAQAVHQADGHAAAATHPAWLRFKQLDALALCLGSTLPVPIPAIPSNPAHPEPVEGRAFKMEQAA